MKMKTTLLVATALLALDLFAANAKAADPVMTENAGFYVSLFGGASFLNDVDADLNYDGPFGYGYSVETKIGYIIGGTIGTRIWEPLRAEIEFSHARWKADEFTSVPDGGGLDYSGDASGHLSATYLLGNLWYDVDTGTSFTPYIGGGAGVAWVDADTRFGDTDFGYTEGGTGFAFQLGAGVTLDVTESIAFDVGYRFKGILYVDFDGRGAIPDYENADLYSHNVQAGVIFSF